MATAGVDEGEYEGTSWDAGDRVEHEDSNGTEYASRNTR